MTTLAWLMLPLLTVLACHQDSKSIHRVIGEIDADEIDVASRLPGRVRALAIAPGQRVTAGDVLVEFEDDVMAAKKKGALATIAAAESKNAIANDAVRPEEKRQLQAAVDAAQEQKRFAQKSLARTRDLLREGAVSQQMLDEVETKARAATEAYRAAVAKMDMAQVGARPEEKAGAQALVDQAKTLLAEVEAYEKDLRLTAPIDGEVVMVLSHEGELVPTGYPVVTLLKIANPWVVARIPEENLMDFGKDRAVSVHLPAIPDSSLHGTVTYVSPLAGFAQRSQTQDRGTLDLKTFEIRVTLQSVPPGLRPGMTAILNPQG